MRSEECNSFLSLTYSRCRQKRVKSRGLDHLNEIRYLFRVVLVGLEELPVEVLPVAAEDVLGERNELFQGLELPLRDEVSAHDVDGVLLVAQAGGVHQFPHLLELPHDEERLHELVERRDLAVLLGDDVDDALQVHGVLLLDEGAEELPPVGAVARRLVDLLKLYDGALEVALLQMSFDDDPVQGILMS